MNFNVTPLFPVPLYSSFIDDDYNAIIKNISNIEFRDMPIGGGKISISKQILEEEFLTSLKGKIQNHLNNFTKNCLGTTDCDFYIKSSWIVKLEKGNYSSSHVHGNSLISGVIYLQSDEQSSLLEFSKDPKYVNLFSSTLEPNIKEYNPFNSNVYSATTRIGTMYLFPSNLSHSVKPHQSNTTRYSLSFDCFAKGIFGENNGAQLIL